MKAHVSRSIARAGALSAVLLSTTLAATTVQAATFVVNSATDTADGSCDASHCSLREAIAAANLTLVSDTISFAIEFPVRGDLMIRPASPLPTIIRPLVINGYSQSLTDPNDSQPFSNAVLRIRIDGGSATPPAIGLAICANNVSIRGISFTGWSASGSQAVVFGRNNANAACADPLTGGTFHGNFVGLTGSGASAVGNRNGLRIENAIVNVGSSAAADRNVFADSALEGLTLAAGSSGSIVQGNLFGTSRNGSSNFGNNNAVSFSASNTVIGTSAAPNYFRFNAVGIRGNSGVDNNLYANRILDSEFLGISLGPVAGVVTPNDPDDADTGANGRANFPVITSVARISGGLHIEGSIDAPITLNPDVYRLGVYASVACHFSGHGEGELFLGTQDVAIRGNSNQTFAIDFLSATSIPLGYVLALTATGPDGTSEFSACMNIDPFSGFAVNSANDVSDAQGCNASHCSLREAITAANARIGPDQIRFDIPVAGTSEIPITLASPLPEISDELTIDGYTQPGATANTDPVVSNAVPRIRIHGDAFSPEYLVSVCAADVTLRGLAFSGANPVPGPSLVFINACGLGNKDRLKLEGNFFGLQGDGTTAVPSQGGVEVAGAESIIGGADPVARNVFAAGTLSISDEALSTQVLGNLFGTDKSGELDHGVSTALQFTGGISAQLLQLQVGSAAAPNLFRYNGIGIRAVANFNPGPAYFTHNRYLQQVGLAIDLGNGTGVSANDPDDNDDGANRGQNFPVLTEAFATETGVRVLGTLDVRANSVNAPFTLSFYANASCDSSGHGEGDRLLGVVDLNFTQTTGESFEVLLDTDEPVLVGEFITALATGANGTSEFSQCRVVADPIEEYVVNSVSDTSDGSCDGTHCSLREAITLANATPGPQIIAFNIAGDGPHEIALTSLLPMIEEDLAIDGYTEPGSVPNAAQVGSDAVLKIAIDAGAQANIFRTCTDDRIEIRGLALLGAEGAAIATNPDTINCSGQQPMLLRGNWIGITPEGGANGNAQGVYALNQKVVVGGGALADRNLFGNNAGFALKLEQFPANASAINNNLFGIGPDGLSDHGNGGTALELLDVDAVDVGGPGFDVNEFRFNARGIVVKNAGGGNAIGNRFYGNEFSDQTGMSIDLSADGSDTDGVTPNDPEDADGGPNALRNSPELESAIPSPGVITVSGRLENGHAVNSAQTLAFYLSESCNNTLRNVASVFAAEISRNFSSSSESFTVQFNAADSATPLFLSATATDQDGTSELSNCVPVALPDDLFVDGFE